MQAPPPCGGKKQMAGQSPAVEMGYRTNVCASSVGTWLALMQIEGQGQSRDVHILRVVERLHASKLHFTPDASHRRKNKDLQSYRKKMIHFENNPAWLKKRKQHF